MLSNLLNYSQFLSDEDFEGIGQYFTTALSSGEEVDLCSSGASKKVTKANLDEFVSLVLKARTHETQDQMKAFMSGLTDVFEGDTSIIQFLNWDTLESRVCGEKVFDVEKFKSITVFENATNALEQRFWRVFASMDEQEKEQYLKFVWGRTRLPTVIDSETKHKVTIVSDMDPTGFP